MRKIPDTILNNLLTRSPSGEHKTHKVMKMDILITKENVTLYNASVTSADIPPAVIVILKTVHGCKLVITRN